MRFAHLAPCIAAFAPGVRPRRSLSNSTRRGPATCRSAGTVRRPDSSAVARARARALQSAGRAAHRERDVLHLKGGSRALAPPRAGAAKAGGGRDVDEGGAAAVVRGGRWIGGRHTPTAGRRAWYRRRVARRVRARSTARDERGPRFTFFGGKGGVGKTTCAAAAAVRAAAEGARVLVVSTDPAHSLADALGRPLGAEARRVASAPGELWAAELDADRALSRWLGEREEAIRLIADRGTYLDDEDIDRFLSLSLPGVDELVGLVELMRLSSVRPLDEIVVDTAPTGHTLRLLEMPDTLTRLGEVLDDMHAKHRFLASSLGAWRPDFADETIAEITREAAALRGVLTDRSRASFTWVTLPEELSVREAEDGVRGLGALGAHVDVVVVNRVWPSPDRPCPPCSARVAAERSWLERLGALFGDRRLLEVLARPREPRGVEELAALARDVRRLEPRTGGSPRGSSLARAVRPLAPRRSTVASPGGPSRGGAIASPRAPSGVATAASSAAAMLAAGVRVVFVGGKGGVGKTTVAAATAIELAEARPDARVLVLSTDPAHSLGDALDVLVTDEARAVEGGPPNLEARELDAARAWEVERVRYRAAVDDLFASIFRGRMDATFDRAVLEDLLDLAPPGIDELLALVTLLDAVVDVGPAFAGAAPAARARRGGYDLVVVDTAPTGHTLRLLALPASALEWVHALMSVILKYRSVIGLGELASDLTILARRLRALVALLTDPGRCAFVIATRPAALPRLETERLARGLGHLRVPLTAIVANAVTTPSCARCSEVAKAERAELDRLTRLAARASSAGRLIVAPAVHPGPRGVAQLRRWRGAWVTRGARAT
ncbi:MAG: TRC40/GET3/ArsA family transport-energizing ATPase [Labilithrix sp.]|nr:TRC40/GET3/ArsA family transport-energizing ATPase [Labilithrix sp.]